VTERLTPEQLRALIDGEGKQPGRNRNRRVMGAQPIVQDGIRFDSRHEARVYGTLCLRRRAGEIADLQRQVKIRLLGRDGPILTPTGRIMHYLADFTWREIRTDEQVVADAKGHPTEIYLLKRAILAAQGIIILEL